MCCYSEWKDENHNINKYIWAQLTFKINFLLINFLHYQSKAQSKVVLFQVSYLIKGKTVLTSAGKFLKYIVRYSSTPNPNDTNSNI